MIPLLPFVVFPHGLAKAQTNPPDRAALSGYRELRTASLPAGDIEVRLWHGGGIFIPRCHILRLHKGRWSAVFLPSGSSDSPKEKLTRPCPPPRSGWPAFWRKAGDLGLWWLPDESTLRQEDVPMGLDTLSYSVEIHRYGTYRSYGYSDVRSRLPETKRVRELFELLNREFGTTKM